MSKPTNPHDYTIEERDAYDAGYEAGLEDGFWEGFHCIIAELEGEPIPGDVLPPLPGGTDSARERNAA